MDPLVLARIAKIHSHMDGCQHCTETESPATCTAAMAILDSFWQNSAHN